MIINTSKENYSFLTWVMMISFIFIYPMLISIHVSLPLLIGVISYIFIESLEKNKVVFMLLSIVYMINLEVNLSLPLFLLLISSLLFYMFIYPSLKYFRKCKMCKNFLSVVLLDMTYLSSLFAFDFLFQTQSIVLDDILIYSLVFDIVIVMFL